MRERLPAWFLWCYTICLRWSFAIFFVTVSWSFEYGLVNFNIIVFIYFCIDMVVLADDPKLRIYWWVCFGNFISIANLADFAFRNHGTNVIVVYADWSIMECGVFATAFYRRITGLLEFRVHNTVLGQNF